MESLTGSSGDDASLSAIVLEARGGNDLKGIGEKYIGAPESASCKKETEEVLATGRAEIKYKIDDEEIKGKI